jgi:hypothetical protein
VFFPAPDDQNVREYLQTEIDGKPIKKASEGSVNKAIWETPENQRQNFTLLNGSLTIIHSDATTGRGFACKRCGMRIRRKPRP